MECSNHCAGYKDFIKECSGLEYKTNPEQCPILKEEQKKTFIRKVNENNPPTNIPAGNPLAKKQ